MLSHRQENLHRGRGRGLATSVSRAVFEMLEGRRLFAVAGVTEGVRLIGITGNQGDETMDETLWEIEYALPGQEAAALDGFEDIVPNPPDTVLSISREIGVTQGSGALRVDVAQGTGAFWGIRSPNVVELLRGGATQLSYDLTLLNRELNGGSFGGGLDDSFNGFAQNNELAVVINAPTGGFIQRNFTTGNATDNSGNNATWAGNDGSRTITWDLTRFTSNGQSLADFIAANNATEARFWIVTQGGDTNGNTGPMRFYFDNVTVTMPAGGVVIGDFEPFSVTRIEQMPHIPDTDSIGFNPRTGLLHHLSGAESWSNNPGSPGFRDNHFMQTLDPEDLTAPGTVVFNANSEQWGPPGPRPTWVLPTTRRTDDQTDGAFRVRGPNEYHAPRDVVWSDAHNAFFLADEHGLFRLTADGQSTFVGAPLSDPANPKSGVDDDLKGLAFFTIGGQRRLLASERADSDTPDHLWTIDPATGQKVGQPVTLVFSDGSPVLGVLSIVEHPDGEVLLGIVQDAEGVAGRKLAQINPVSGEVTVLGNFMTHMADLAFVWPAGGPSVTAVHVGGTAWTPEFLAELAEENLGGPRGYRVDGAGGDLPLPWSNINQVSITFDQDVVVDQSDLTVRGVRIPAYNVTAFTYDAPSRTATWTLDRPLANFSTTNRQAADEVTIQLATDVADYELTLDAVPGDANRNGNVAPTDYGLVRSGVGRNTVDEGTSPNHYTVYKDVNANGNVSPTDIGVVRGNTGAAAPAPPAAGSLALSSATRDVLFGTNEIL